MSQLQSQSIPQDKFLLMCVNLLHKAFIESARTDAKNAYRDMAAGKVVNITTVQMEDRSTVQFNMSMDHSEFRGKLNYGAFRASVGVLINNLSQWLRDEKEVPVFDGGERDKTRIFGVTAVTVENKQPNVMVLGANTADSQAAVMLRLAYLNPDQFTSNEQPTPPAASA